MRSRTKPGLGRVGGASAADRHGCAVRFRLGPGFPRCQPGDRRSGIRAGSACPSANITINTGKEAEATRAAYVAHLSRMLARPASSNHDEAAAAVMAFETRLATAQPDRCAAARSDPALSQAAGRRFGPADAGLPMDRLSARCRRAKLRGAQYRRPRFLRRGCRRRLADTPLDTIKLYLRAHLLAAMRPICCRGASSRRISSSTARPWPAPRS